MSVGGVGLGGVGMQEFQLLPFLLFGLDVGLDVGLVVVVVVTKFLQFLFGLHRQGFLVLLQVLLGLLHDLLMMVEFLWSGSQEDHLSLLLFGE